MPVGYNLAIAGYINDAYFAALSHKATYAYKFDTSSGLLRDYYGGRWGERKEIDAFLQTYAVEVARLEARKRGHTVTEQQLADGSIKLTIQVAGGAA